MRDVGRLVHLLRNAPVQAVVIPIADRHLEYAATVKNVLAAGSFRTEVDDRNERMNLKIRNAQMQKVPYMLVVGDKEMEAQTASVRHREEGDLGAMALEALLEKLSGELGS